MKQDFLNKHWTAVVWVALCVLSLPMVQFAFKAYYEWHSFLSNPGKDTPNDVVFNYLVEYWNSLPLEIYLFFVFAVTPALIASTISSSYLFRSLIYGGIIGFGISIITVINIPHKLSAHLPWLSDYTSALILFGSMTVLSGYFWLRESPDNLSDGFKGGMLFGAIPGQTIPVIVAGFLVERGYYIHIAINTKHHLLESFGYLIDIVENCTIYFSLINCLVLFLGFLGAARSAVFQFSEKKNGLSITILSLMIAGPAVAIVDSIVYRDLNKNIVEVATGLLCSNDRMPPSCLSLSTFVTPCLVSLIATFIHTKRLWKCTRNQPLLPNVLICTYYLGTASILLNTREDHYGCSIVYGVCAILLGAVAILKRRRVTRRGPSTYTLQQSLHFALFLSYTIVLLSPLGQCELLVIYSIDYLNESIDWGARLIQYPPTCVKENLIFTNLIYQGCLFFASFYISSVFFISTYLFHRYSLIDRAFGWLLVVDGVLAHQFRVHEIQDNVGRRNRRIKLYAALGSGLIATIISIVLAYPILQTHLIGVELFLSLFGVIASLLYYADTDGSIRVLMFGHPTGQLRFSRSAMNAVLLANGDILIQGGAIRSDDLERKDLSSVKSSERFMVKSGKWEPTEDLSGSRMNHAAVTLANGSVLIAGGISNSGDHVGLATCEIFDPALGSWKMTGNLSLPMRYPHSFLLKNGWVLITDGEKNCEVYNPEQGMWWKTDSLPETYAGFDLLTNGTVIAISGRDGASCALYDPKLERWKEGPPLITACSTFATRNLPDGRLLLIGGDSVDGKPLNVCQIYDPVTDAWTMTGKLAVARSACAAACLPNGKILAIGGAQGEKALNSCELYDPKRGTWLVTGSMKVERSAFVMTCLADGRVLVTGGEDPRGVTLQDSEIYDLVTGKWLRP